MTRLRIIKDRGALGFTLVELLVVVVIIAVLAAIAVPIFLNQKTKATQAATKSTVTTLANALATGKSTGGTVMVTSSSLVVTDGTGATQTVPIPAGYTLRVKVDPDGAGAAAALNGTAIAAGTSLALSTWCVSAVGPSGENIQFTDVSTTPNSNGSTCYSSAGLDGGTSLGGVDGYIYLPGVSSNFLSVPYSSSFNTTDVDMRVKIAWNSSSYMSLISRINGVISYRWILNANGTVEFRPWIGGAARSVASTASVPYVNGDVFWIRVTLDADNGAGGRDYKFWSSTDGSSWTQLGTTVTAAGPATFDPTNAQVEIGSWSNGASGYSNGRYYRAVILNGIDGATVLDVDASSAPAGFAAGTAGSFTAVSGQTVTMNSTNGSGMFARP